MVLTRGYKKTRVKNHRVPIDEEIAKILKALTDESKRVSTSKNNPKKYLFPVLKGRRTGRPFLSNVVSSALNRWAKNYNIVDENGVTYHFRNHAFRHTKAVELINLGMNLVHIQKWMAHCSPEMTLVYAKILDTTLRNEWLVAKEKTQANPVRVNFKKGDVNNISDGDLLEWEYIRHNLEAAKVPLGYCMASKKLSCPFVETPCLTCSNFCTTPDMLPEFKNEIAKTKKVIETTQNMPIYNEKNVKYLERLTLIADKLTQGKIHHDAGKLARELSKIN